MPAELIILHRLPLTTSRGVKIFIIRKQWGQNLIIREQWGVSEINRITPVSWKAAWRIEFGCL